MKVTISLVLIFILSSSNLIQEVSYSSGEYFIYDQCYQESLATSKQQMELEFFNDNLLLTAQKSLLPNTEQNQFELRDFNMKHRKLIRRAAF